MPRKRHATRSRIQNLNKKKKENNQTNIYSEYISHPSGPSQSQTSETILPFAAPVLNEPDSADTLDLDDDVPTVPNTDSDDSEDSGIEILDDGSDTDIHEETELAKFSRMLCEAQKRAQDEERAKGIMWKTYNGKSRTTEYRRKRIRNNLAAQGFLPIHEFTKRMAQKNTKELTPSQDPSPLTFEESEESSDDNAAPVSQPRSESGISEGIDVDELAPAAWDDCCQVAQGPVASEGCRRATYCPAESGGHHQVVRGLVTGEKCRQLVQGLQEEEEESAESEGEDEGTTRKGRAESEGKDEGITREDRPDAARKDGTHGAALFEDL